MRVLIPAAGVGKRLQPHTFTLPKVLLRLAGKPMIAHIMDIAEKIEPEEVVIVVGYKSEIIKKYLSRYEKRFKLLFVDQQEMLGLGHAVYITGDSDKDTLIILGDTIFRFDLKQVVKSAGNSIGVAQVQDPRRFGVVELNEDKTVKRLVEKPANPTSNLAIVGLYRIRDFHDLYNSLRHLIESGKKTSGEIQLTDALEKMVEDGKRIGVFGIDQWLDCGKPETLLSTQAFLLGENTQRHSIPTSSVLEPVFISKGAVIQNSVIGPNVDVGENCVIKNCVIRDAIIGMNSVISDSLLERSIVGDNSRIEGHFKKIQICKNSEVIF
ncbi:NTP transferase domain-containing protein [candidate division WOR-3 bacterium]|nr:NTP transferase domain-containing protein [candidate division WOR-3 bacterium]